MPVFCLIGIGVLVGWLLLLAWRFWVGEGQDYAEKLLSAKFTVGGIFTQFLPWVW